MNLVIKLFRLLKYIVYLFSIKFSYSNKSFVSILILKDTLLDTIKKGYKTRVRFGRVLAGFKKLKKSNLNEQIYLNFF